MSKELHQSEVKRGAENLCGTALLQAERIDEYRTASAEANARENRCIGELDQTRLAAQQLLLKVAEHQKWAPPLWLVLPLRFVAVGATGAAAYSLARGLPPEVSVGLAVGGIGALVVDVVLTLIR